MIANKFSNISIIILHGLRPNGRRFAAILAALAVLFVSQYGWSAGIDSMPKITLEFRDTDIRDVLQAISAASGINIAADSGVEGKISIRLNDMALEQALRTVVETGKCFYKFDGELCKVSKNPFPNVSSVLVDDYGLISVQARDADLRELLLDISRKARISVVPSVDISKKISVELQSILPADILPILAKAGGIACSQVNGIWYADVQPQTPSPQPQKQNTDSVKPSEKPAVDEDAKRIITQIIQPKYLKASQVLEYISKSCIAEATSLTGSPPEMKKTTEDNALLVTATRSAIERIRREIEQIDIPAPQVMLEARILDVSMAKEKNLGLILAKGSEGNVAIDVLQGQVAYVMKGVSKDLNASFQSLVQRGDAKIVANPSICTLTGREACIDIGQVRYFKITNYPDNNQPGGQLPVYYPYSTLQTITAGISLKITPWVGSSGEITATIQPEVSNVTGLTPEGLPEINRRKASTTIRVHDGDTIVIGGLKQQERIKSVAKVPILGDLPIVGQLFNNTKNTIRDSELLIFITPRILSSEYQSPNVNLKDTGDKASK